MSSSTSRNRSTGTSTPRPSTPDDYSDIINLPRPLSKTRPRMSKSARAAQFAPYAALVGHRDIIAGEEEVAFAKDNIDHEITTDFDPDFSQENPLDS